jgi:hypothetical protein
MSALFIKSFLPVFCNRYVYYALISYTEIDNG